MSNALYFEARLATQVKMIGAAVWIVVVAIGVWLDNGEIIAGAGATGLVFLAWYVWIQQREIERSRKGMRNHFRGVKLALDTITDDEYEKLDPNDQHALNEAGADYGSAEKMFEENVETVQKRELSLFALLTIQWAFGAPLFDLVSGFFGKGAP